jgi:hypothetical protein
MPLKGSFFFIFLYEMVSADNGFLALDSCIYENEHRFPFSLYVYLYCITEIETIVYISNENIGAKIKSDFNWVIHTRLQYGWMTSFTLTPPRK